MGLPLRRRTIAVFVVQRVVEAADEVVDGGDGSVGKVDGELPELVEAESAVSVLVQRSNDGGGHRV